MRLLSLWYQQKNAVYPFWYYLLAPLCVLFFLLSGLRRWLYRKGIMRATNVDAIVIVVGNISVGGNGKTPLAIFIAERVTSWGFKPGVLSRGYGGSQSDFPYKVNITDDASQVGDEPSLICKRLGIPVVIDPKRVRGAQYLLENCDVDVIICDDGLQHYALKRDIELVVMDSRGAGNGRLLPMGPLRESVNRLNHVDAIICNVNTQEAGTQKNSMQDKLSQTLQLNNVQIVTPQYDMTLVPSKWVNVLSGEVRDISAFVDLLKGLSEPITAIAGIGYPQRFFTTLDTMNVPYNDTIAFQDHQEYVKSDLPNGLVLMTEKDAVKCKAFASSQYWYLVVSASVSASFEQTLQSKLALLKR